MPRKKTTGKSPLIAFRSNIVSLSGTETKILAEEGRDLFSLLKMTPAATDFLKYHKKLAEVIKKW